MSSIPPPDSAGPQLLPSLPPSPTEEDLSRAHAWSDSEHSHEDKEKGKTKFVEGLYEDEGDGSPPQELSGAEAYPPVNDDEAETRRVEENLKRWELAERQRRKAARESTASISSPTSLVSDVTRRASLLWPSRKSQQASRGSLGAHTALKSRDSVDVVPLEPFEPSPVPSPTPSARGDSPENPFSHPEDPSSPFADSHQLAAVMSASSEPPTPTVRSEKRASGSKGILDQPVLEAIASSSSFLPNQPPPQPLGLPPPRTPPPLADFPRTIRPPKSTPPPALSPSVIEQEQKENTRWWHDWLCGCSEGPDRGGDNQAGRTNPFE